MLKNATPYLKNDLRKKTSLSDVIFFNNISFQSCMVILAVFAVLLFSVLSIAITPNPSVVFGI